jgi:hypothetical protein
VRTSWNTKLLNIYLLNRYDINSAKVKTRAYEPTNPNDNISNIKPPEKALNILSSSSSSRSKEKENAKIRLKFNPGPNNSCKNEV